LNVQQPSVGRVVHYVSYGTPGGEYTSECRAADVTEVDSNDPERVGLCVKNPTGLFFHPLAAGGCRYHRGDPSSAPGITALSYPGGTWHWPERVGA
jgi:hypothetical protein